MCAQGCRHFARTLERRTAKWRVQRPFELRARKRRLLVLHHSLRLFARLLLQRAAVPCTPIHDAWAHLPLRFRDIKPHHGVHFTRVLFAEARVEDLAPPRTLDGEFGRQHDVAGIFHEVHATKSAGRRVLGSDEKRRRLREHERLVVSQHVRVPEVGHVHFTWILSEDLILHCIRSRLDTQPRRKLVVVHANGVGPWPRRVRVQRQPDEVAVLRSRKVRRIRVVLRVEHAVAVHVELFQRNGVLAAFIVERVAGTVVGRPQHFRRIVTHCGELLKSLLGERRLAAPREPRPVHFWKRAYDAPSRQPAFREVLAQLRDRPKRGSERSCCDGVVQLLSVCEFDRDHECCVAPSRRRVEVCD
mmetsp:Transcript_8324/g.22133  ORF Transcript_8324/g.22133 Transcript_8324/m.22133 type:complete len:359 (+) Transcript_8324:1049-2125(+)